jgi:tRNA pseudouridine38-40 synthase
LNLEKLNEAAQQIIKYKDFKSFSKQNTQVNNFNCKIEKSEWRIEDDALVYNVVANRFLRGMVKGLTGTMLRLGTDKISVDAFIKIIEEKNSSNVDFSPPSHALFLISVNYKHDDLM